MSTYFPFNVKQSAHHHAENKGNDDGRKIMWYIQSVEYDAAATIADGC